MKRDKLKAIVGYKKPMVKNGKPLMVVPNKLEQNFDVAKPDEARVPDINAPFSTKAKNFIPLLARYSV